MGTRMAIKGSGNGGGGFFRSMARHPRGLVTLSALELWERFSFYGLQVIVAYYMYFAAGDGGLGLSEAQALAIVGAYGGGVYLLQPVGAWIADRLLAVKYVVALAGCLIMAGHLTLAFVPGLGGLLAGLVLITIGTGGLFTNTVSITGQLYENDPDERDSGFALFYAAIMLGALFGPLTTGYLQATKGFHVAFSAAAIGMAIGLFFFLSRLSSLPPAAGVVPNPLDDAGRMRALLIGAAGGILVAIALASGMVNITNIDAIVLGLIALTSAAYFAMMLRDRDLKPAEHSAILALLPLFLVSVIFWALVLQLFTTFAIYAEKFVDLSLGPITIPAAYISTFEVATGIIAGPLVAYGWQRMGERQPGSVAKMILGMLLMAVAYGIFTLLATRYETQVGLVPVILGMIVFGFAEIVFAPIAFSVTTQLAPRRYHAQVVALSGLALGGGASLSGYVGQLYTRTDNYTFFATVTVCILATTLVLFLLRPWLWRLMTAPRS